MALPFAAILNALARQALPLIQGGVQRGLSSTAISDTLKTTFGKSIRRATLLNIIRRYKAVKTQGAQLKFLPRLSRPNPLRLPPALTKIRRKYSFVVRLLGNIEGTLERIEQMVTISTDKILTRAQMEDIAMSIVADNGDRYPIIDVEATLMSGVQAGPEGFL